MFVRTGLGARPITEVDETALVTESTVFATPVPPLVKVPPRPVPSLITPEFINAYQYSEVVKRGGGGKVPRGKLLTSPVPAVQPPVTAESPGGAGLPLLLSALAFFLFKGNA